MPGVDLFGGFGYTHARFSDGSTALGLDVSDNEIPEHADGTPSTSARSTAAR